MRRVTFALLFAVLALLPMTAQARNTEQFFPAKEAAESELGKAKLFSVPFYLKGQPHPKVKKTIFELSTDQSTRGVFRSDEDSCRVAFLSAIRALQNTAQEKGGDAIIDIVSITRGKQTESSKDYRCVAGATVVHVGLKGKIVELAE